jgi:hypothetical protein
MTPPPGNVPWADLIRGAPAAAGAPTTPDGVPVRGAIFARQIDAAGAGWLQAAQEREQELARERGRAEQAEARARELEAAQSAQEHRICDAAAQVGAHSRWGWLSCLGRVAVVAVATVAGLYTVFGEGRRTEPRAAGGGA